MNRNAIDIKKDRMRYTNNRTSSTLAILGILFNVLYFVNIYISDVKNTVGDYYYTYTIGISVVLNLLFLLAAFLCSEGVKNYKMPYSFGLLGLGAFQIVRIFGIPTNAHSTYVPGSENLVMSDSQFRLVCAYLILSAIACFASGVIGIYKTIVLKNYLKEIANK